MKQTTRNSTTSAALSEVSGLSRRSFLTKASVAGAIALSPLSALANGGWNDHEDDDVGHGRLRKGDKAILIAAEIAEALAVTTYTNIIDMAPFFPNIPLDDHGYLKVFESREGRRDVTLSAGTVCDE
jgi:hypothetical protein